MASSDGIVAFVVTEGVAVALVLIIDLTVFSKKYTKRHTGSSVSKPNACKQSICGEPFQVRLRCLWRSGCLQKSFNCSHQKYNYVAI